MKAAIIGITGYTGLELLRLINKHPFLEIGGLYSHSYAEQNLDDVYPYLKNLVKDNQLIKEFDAKEIMAANDLVFFATPSGVSKDQAQIFLDANFPVIDLSGDYRLKDASEYEKWYKSSASHKDYLGKVNYQVADLAHLETKSIKNSSYISNPGCYATATILALTPLVKEKLIDLSSIIVDGKSGLSGAGKKLTDTSHYVTASENMTLYKVHEHQHIPEIIQYLKNWDNDLQALHFTTSLIPVKRGIFITAYAKVKKGVTESDLQQAFENIYAEKYFVRLQEQGRLPELRQVTASNFCDLGLSLNDDTGVVTVVAVIDNLVKGAAGQAIQNYNLWAGIDEKLGLEDIPLFP
ncbi:N-acetyl-gamma-glutamyl-phosphate reductase [Floricoccus penangensis]|uniref:N-acetyl-gamma-glutamyl-phosphate reductase n=1 Tax=Floricoccus penangensis TaxID=1859475 RepID=UPI00203DF3CE|nr:N-acetyl-gamma-glutamyl-phosphate reductase [Floricoccus penangensis]URZ87371.1 N-acetyl-gamma-glutamyl-phosphate reductase [Floricoccus penangensis]